MNNYYVYAYLRSKDSGTAKAGTPYYIGKGCGNRAYEQHRINGKGVWTPKDKSLIVFLQQNLTEQEAHHLEIQLIATHGRKDIKTGILENRTNGGEGVSGIIITEETVAKRLATMNSKPIEEKEILSNKKSLSMIGKNKGKIIGPQSLESRTNKSIAYQAKSAEQKASIAHKKSIALKGIVRSQVTCPHCNKTGGSNLMKRYHLDNCKEKQ